MAIGDKTYPWAMHTAWGYLSSALQNVIETTGAYTNNKKIVSAGTAGAVLSSTASTTSIQTITAGITQPDVPRVLAITMGGAAGDILASAVTIVGVNVEGKPITDTITPTLHTAGQTIGSLVFKRVTSITYPAQGGTDVTLTIDTTNRLGLNHRLVPSYSTIACLSSALTSPYTDHTTTAFHSNLPIVEAAVSASNLDGEFVEKNWAQPATTPNGTTFIYFFYWFYKVLVYPPKDSPEFYSTTTSTSTSTSSTSTSSTSSSMSTSQTTFSTSSTSASTSSTSTSTTTLPV